MLCFVQKLNGRSNLLVSSIRGSNRFASSGGSHVGVMKLVLVRGMIQAYVQASTSSNKAFSLYGFHFSLLYCCSDSPIKQASLFSLCFSSKLSSSSLLHQANSWLKKKKLLTNQRKKKELLFFFQKQNRMQHFTHNSFFGSKPKTQALHSFSFFFRENVVIPRKKNE